MIAIIEIPHRGPPRIHWYDSEEGVIEAAEDRADATGRGQPGTFDGAVACLADEWHTHLLVQCVMDIQKVGSYAGHGKWGVWGMTDELRKGFGGEVPTRDRLIGAAPALLAACQASLMDTGHTFECDCSRAKDRQMNLTPRCIKSCLAIREAIAMAGGTIQPTDAGRPGR